MPPPETIRRFYKNTPKKTNESSSSDLEKNQGFSSAIRQGLLLAQGEYVHFMDSDDLIKSNAYETLYNTAKKNELEILIFFYDWYDVQTNSIKIHNIPLQDEAPFSFAKNSHRLNKFLTLWNKIIKKTSYSITKFSLILSLPWPLETSSSRLQRISPLKKSLTPIINSIFGGSINQQAT